MLTRRHHTTHSSSDGCFYSSCRPPLPPPVVRYLFERRRSALVLWCIVLSSFFFWRARGLLFFCCIFSPFHLSPASLCLWTRKSSRTTRSACVVCRHAPLCQPLRQRVERLHLCTTAPRARRARRDGGHTGHTRRATRSVLLLGMRARSPIPDPRSVPMKVSALFLWSRLSNLYDNSPPLSVSLKLSLSPR